MFLPSLLYLRTLAKIAIVTEGSKVLDHCHSAERHRRDVIEMKFATNLGSRVATAKHATKTIATEHIVTETETDSDTPSGPRLRTGDNNLVIYRRRLHKSPISHRGICDVGVHTLDKRPQCTTPGAPLRLVRTRTDPRRRTFHFAVVGWRP